MVPPAPKSHRATKPSVGKPGLDRERREAGRGVGDQNRGDALGGQARLGEELAASHRRGLGIGPIRGDRDGDRRSIADGARQRLERLTISRSPTYFVPSAATSGFRSPTRSTKPRITRPGSVRFGFSSGRPTSLGRSSNSVNTTELRVTGAPPRGPQPGWPPRSTTRGARSYRVLPCLLECRHSARGPHPSCSVGSASSA